MSVFGARVWVTRGFGFASWGIQGPPGFFQNSGEFSLLMAIAVAMSIPYFVSLDIKRKYFWLLPVTATMTVMGASSRGGQLAILLGFLYLILAYKKFKIKNVLYVGAVCWLVVTYLPEEQKARFSSMGEDNTSTSRINYWKAGIEMAKDYPLLGVGYSAFPEYYQHNYKVLDGSYLSHRREVAHNSLVQVGSSLGIPALMRYLILHMLIYRPFKRFNNKLDKDELYLERLLRASVLTYFVGAFFMSIAFYPYIYLLLSIRIAANRVCNNV